MKQFSFNHSAKSRTIAKMPTEEKRRSELPHLKEIVMIELPAKMTLNLESRARNKGFSLGDQETVFFFST